MKYLIGLLLLVALSLQASPSLAQQGICRTANIPSTANNCASEAFVTDHFPGSSTPGDVAVFSDGSGNVLQDGGPLGLTLTPHTAVLLATTAALPANTYANGAAGVGATLTGNAVGVIQIDSTNLTLNGRVLIQNEVATAHNGIYTITTVGTSGAAYVLTRATDANSPGTGSPTRIGLGTYVLVTGGSTLASTGWYVNSAVATIGTSAITWVQFSAGAGVSSVSNSDGTLTISTIAGAVIASINQVFNYVWTGIHKFYADVYFGSGRPWVDVKSGANSCPAAVGNGSTDDTNAISCQSTYMNNTYGGGIVYFPPGTYLVSGGGVGINGGVQFIGSGQASTTIKVTTDSSVVSWNSSCARGTSLQSMTILGYQNTGASHNTVFIYSNCPVIIRDATIWYGGNAIYNAGVDSLIENVFACGYSASVFSTGANWYVRDKFDTCGISATFGFYQGAYVLGAGKAENHFVETDFSGVYTYSVYINDSAEQAITVFDGGVFSAPIYLNAMFWTSFTNAEIGSTSFTLNVSAGYVTVANSYAFSTTGISGGSSHKACSNNINFSC
jgi:hypothetical protein